MKLADAVGDYRLATRHNPRHFISDSFAVEVIRGRAVVVGRVRRRELKNFRIVGFLKHS